MSNKITLAHGAGGQMSRQLLDEIILPAFGNSTLNVLHDGAILNLQSPNLAFTTDSYVIRPLFFKGGDIGKLSICGTVNDLAMSGAVPKFLSVGMIIEEGFLIDDLRQIVQSMKVAADEANIKIVTGDTKVVSKGQCDGIFINTAGIGQVIEGVNINPHNVKVGMKVLISGTIGDHAASILASRHNLELNLNSDCAPLSEIVAEVLKTAPNIPTLRDPTRGGVAAVLNEIAEASNVEIIIDEASLPIREEVRGVCDILGFDVLELANEGKFVAFVPESEVDEVLKIMKSHRYGSDAEIIGEVTKNIKGRVGLRTSIGSVRVVDMPLGAIVPRIC